MREGRTEPGLVFSSVFPLHVFILSDFLPPKKAKGVSHHLLILLNLFSFVFPVVLLVFDRIFCLLAIFYRVNILCLFCSLAICCFLEAYCMYTYLHLSLWWSCCSNIYIKKFTHCIWLCHHSITKYLHTGFDYIVLVHFLQYTYFTLLFTVVLVHIWV